MTTAAGFTIGFICAAITVATLYVTFVLVGNHLGGTKHDKHA